jgi:hypothetical protein
LLWHHLPEYLLTQTKHFDVKKQKSVVRTGNDWYQPLVSLIVSLNKNTFFDINNCCSGLPTDR